MKEITSGKLHLWNIAEDLGEHNNLIEKYPTKAEKMYRIMTFYFNSVG